MMFGFLFVMFTRSGWDCFVRRRNPVGQNARKETRETERLYEGESNDRFGKMCGEFECFFGLFMHTVFPHILFFVFAFIY